MDKDKRFKSVREEDESQKLISSNTKKWHNLFVSANKRLLAEDKPERKANE